MSLLDSFPLKYTPTDIQKSIIKKIEETLSSGYTNIILCAPTGIGKSHIATTVANHLSSSFIVTGQKILQDQYTRDFPWMNSLKGKNNFLCLDLWDEAKLSFEEAIQQKNLRCNNGICTRIENGPHGKKILIHCSYKPKIEEYRIKELHTEREAISGPENICLYYDQKYKALHSSHTICNYSSFFQNLKFSQGVEGNLERNCVIADEAHEIEDQILNFIKFEIFPTYLTDVDDKFSNYDFSNVEQFGIMLNNLKNLYSKKIESDLDDSKKNNFEIRLQNIKIILNAIEENSENILINEKKDIHDEIEKIVFTPLEIKDYVKDFFNFPIQIFMSATINHEIFCETMGFEKNECAFIEVEKSPFPIKNRKINFLNICSLSLQSPQSDWEKVFSQVDKILQNHPNEKGLILTNTITQCNELLNYFSEYSEDSWLRIKPVFSNLEEEKERILENHKDTDVNQVLLSPSLWYGVDLKGDLSRFQIILKTPFASIGDQRIKRKLSLNPEWYDYKTLVKVIQGFGRSVRDKDDFAETFVLDTKTYELIQKMKSRIPKAYHDVLNITL